CPWPRQRQGGEPARPLHFSNTTAFAGSLDDPPTHRYHEPIFRRSLQFLIYATRDQSVLGGRVSRGAEWMRINRIRDPTAEAVRHAPSRRVPIVRQGRRTSCPPHLVPTRRPGRISRAPHQPAAAARSRHALPCRNDPHPPARRWLECSRPR